MRAAGRISLLLSLLAAGELHAQYDVFDPDDFVDPRLTQGQVIFVSRFVAGAALDFVDQYRPVRQDVGYVHLANTLYWGPVQIDLKHSEVRGENGKPALDSRANQSFGQIPVREQAARDAPLVPGPKTLVQFSLYQSVADRATLRYSVGGGRQYALPETAAADAGLEEHDDTRMAQVDLGLRLGRRRFFGTLTWSELTRHSTFDERKQRTVTATALLPLLRVGPAILTPRVAIGDVSGGRSVDTFNPSFDLCWRVPKTGANLHLVYSPVLRDFGTGTEVHHQIAIFADRALVFDLRGKS